MVWTVAFGRYTLAAVVAAPKDPVVVAAASDTMFRTETIQALLMLADTAML